MTEEEFNEISAIYKFKKYANISSNDKHEYAEIKCLLEHEPSSIGGYVYLWVETSSNKVSIKYVGKAGKTMRARCTQHQNGFKHSKTGQKHSSNILAGINANKTYHVYYRESSVRKLLGEKVPMCSVEELAFITKLNPCWNKITS